MSVFDYFCPMINKDCLGDKCAAFITNKHGWHEYDAYKKTTLTAQKPKDKDCEYVIEDYHLVKNVEVKDFFCHNYPHLRETEKTETPMNKTVTTHERQHKYSIMGIPRNSYKSTPKTIFGKDEIVL